MPRPRRDVPPAEVERLAAIRAAAAKAQAKAAVDMDVAVMADMPDPDEDILGAIAWATTVRGPGDRLVLAMVERALAQRLEWREVVVAALGVDPDDGAAVLNAAQSLRRYRARG